MRFHRGARKERRVKKRASYVSYANFCGYTEAAGQPRLLRNHASERAAPGQLFGAKCKRLYRLLTHPFVRDRCVNGSWWRPVKTLSRRRFVKKHAVTQRTDDDRLARVSSMDVNLYFLIGSPRIRFVAPYRAGYGATYELIEETIYEATPAERVIFEITSYPINKCHSLSSSFSLSFSLS